MNAKIEQRPMVYVERLEFCKPAIDWCPWCGEGDTDGDFCSSKCRREYHDDIKREMPHEASE